MEYVEGCTLDQLLGDLGERGEPLPLPQTLAIVGALCQALEAAQEGRDSDGRRHPLVHGAIKPSNVLLGRHEAVKLADFGAPPSPSDRQAPEQAAGEPADTRSDVYALGLILFELLTNRRVEAPLFERPLLPAPSTLRPRLPRALDAVVARATRPAARARHGSAEELYQALARAMAEDTIVSPTMMLGDWVERVRQTERPR
jgi:serine/threonine protein kinase